MMERTFIKDIGSKVSKEVLLKGWVHTIRDQGSIKFVLLRDITGICQLIFTQENKEVFDKASGLSLESVVEVVGVAQEMPQAPKGLEIKATSIVTLSEAAAELPIPVVEKGGGETEQPKRLDWRWIDLRKPEKALIFKVWTWMEHYIREYFINEGFFEIHSPKFMSTPSESGAELFEVKYFDKTAYLAQSPQFYKQMAMASGFEKVFEVGPVFRANPSFTSRHDTEFTGYDFEISFIESHYDVMEQEEKLLAYVLKKLEERFGQDIEHAYGRKLVAPKTPFPKVSMQEAKEILAGLGVISEKDGDLSPEEERRLSEHILKEKGSEFVFITECPVDVRPFYHMRVEGDPALTKSFDLLWNGIEITTGAQREHRHDVLVAQAEEKGIGLESIKHYLNFFKYGCPPHGGIGFGPTRMLMKIFDISNVRDVTYLYRGVKRLTP
ncbi:aspartate--tRNA(Asn) ligase [Candidatus Nomurabacteria bacterium]|nr:aspartate--tRNA(Asn) ligase [Candidatus Nomurabacteria bacterium]MCB9827706.1 aspartate--tRNA(Asn) ligase [Candidatus Nomurabacteria bacterium]